MVGDRKNRGGSHRQSVLGIGRGFVIEEKAHGHKRSDRGLTVVPNMLPSPMTDVREYLDHEGNSPFAVWFDDLNAPAAAKVTMGVTRLGQGNLAERKREIDNGFDPRF